MLLRNHLIKAYGYFVAGPDSRGVIGPNPHIHRPWKGQATAFSFNRDLRRLFVSLYQIGEFVTEFLRGIGTPEPHDWKGASADELYDIAQRISRLPTFYFVDEVPNRNPVVFVPAGGVRKINIADDAARPTPVPVARPFQATVQYLGDGATTMFKIPYMGKE